MSCIYSHPSLYTCLTFIPIHHCTHVLHYSHLSLYTCLVIPSIIVRMSCYPIYHCTHVLHWFPLSVYSFICCLICHCIHPILIHFSYSNGIPHRALFLQIYHAFIQSLASCLLTCGGIELVAWHPKLSGVDRSAQTRQVHIKSPRKHLHTPPNPSCSRWYDHEWLKADYKPDSRPPPTHTPIPCCAQFWHIY